MILSKSPFGWQPVLSRHGRAFSHPHSPPDLGPVHTVEDSAAITVSQVALEAETEIAVAIARPSTIAAPTKIFFMTDY